MTKKTRTPLKTKPKAFTDIGSYLKSCRTTLDASQKEIAKKVGYGSSQILSNIERGSQGIPTKKLGRFVKAYNADPKELFNILVENNKKRIAAELKIKL
jgi:transcriptional regulator with XRE-family HTH domain